MSLSRYTQIRWLTIILGAWLIIFSLTRLVLLASHFGDVNTTLFGVLGIFGLGLVHDLSFLSYAALPMVCIIKTVGLNGFEVGHVSKRLKYKQADE